MPPSVDMIPPGTFYTNVTYRRIKYRTKDGQADYEFSFERTHDGKHRAYILSQPPYGYRNTDVLVTHRSVDADNRLYVCWTPEPTDEATLRKVVSLWCDMTQEYIRSGRPLEAQLREAMQRRAG